MLIDIDAVYILFQTIGKVWVFKRFYFFFFFSSSFFSKKKITFSPSSSLYVFTTLLNFNSSPTLLTFSYSNPNKMRGKPASTSSSEKKRDFNCDAWIFFRMSAAFTFSFSLFPPNFFFFFPILNSSNFFFFSSQNATKFGRNWIFFSQGR